MRPLLRLCLAAACLLCCATGFPLQAAPDVAPPPDAPRWQVKYDPGLSSAFFRQERRSLPWHIVKHDDGTLEDTLGGSVKKVRKLVHTADCSSAYMMEHTIHFADAWIEADGTLGIYVHDFTAATNDQLLLKVKDGQFSAHYWTYHVAPRGAPVWRVLKASLTLQNARVPAGRVLRGFIDLELAGDSPDGGRRTNRIRGYIKPKVSGKPPAEVRERAG